jgi:cytochrome c
MKHNILNSLFQSSIKISLILTSFMLVNTTAYADKALAQSKNCLSCHNVQRKLIGPSIKSIAEKYSNADTNQILALTKKVREGGVGVWGSIPMSSNPQVTVTESELLVKWFLAGGN